MNIDIEKNLEGLNDDCKELMRAQIELLGEKKHKDRIEEVKAGGGYGTLEELIIDQIDLLVVKKPKKCGKKKPMTFEEKLKERFGILYSQDENDTFGLGTSDFWNNED